MLLTDIFNDMPKKKLWSAELYTGQLGVFFFL